MELPAYAWLVDSRLERTVLQAMLEPYRPYRIEVNFSNGFSTREFGDTVAYSNPAPLAKLHAFEPLIETTALSRILDIGCHLGYYGHHFIARGASFYCGIEVDERLFDSAKLIRTIAGMSRDRLSFIHGDFGDPASASQVQRLGPFDVIVSLASLNNILSLPAALLTLADLLAPEGTAVIEYLAAESDEAICRFHATGFQGDGTHYWSFSEMFLDNFLAARGLVKTSRPLEWVNEAVLGAGFKKIMSLYRRRIAGAAHC